MLYLISYDIQEIDSADERAMVDRLRSWGAVQCLYSQYLYNSPYTATEVADMIRVGMSASVRVLVTRVQEAAWYRLRNEQQATHLLQRAP